MEMLAVCWPLTLLQSTLKKTLCSGELEEIEPEEGELLSHVTLLVTAKVKAAGPPRPTSMKRFPKVLYESMDITALPQPKPEAQLYLSSPGLHSARLHQGLCWTERKDKHAPSTHASLDSDPHRACKVLLLRLHELHRWHPRRRISLRVLADLPKDAYTLFWGCLR